MGGSLLYLRGAMQGRERSEGKSIPEMGLQSLGQGSWIRARNGEGRAGPNNVEFQKRELRFVEGQDTWGRI